MPELGLARPLSLPLGFLALLHAAELLVLPLLVFFGGGTLVWLLPILIGVAARALRLALHQRVRRRLRQAFMVRAACDSLERAEPTEAGADASFWGAHILEYALCVDVPAIVGAALGGIVIVSLAASRIGVAAVAAVLVVLLIATLAGLLASRLRRREVDAIVERRHEMAVWMAAALEDRGEIRSGPAVTAFVSAARVRANAWSMAEDRVERMQAWHRGLIVAGAVTGLLVGARSLGLAAHFSGSMTLDALSSFLLVGALLPASYALHVHLESLAVARGELLRLRPKSVPHARGTRALTHPPRVMTLSGVSVEYSGQRALTLDALHLDLTRPIVVTGPNGAGKTTLAKLVAGLLRPTHGSVAIDGIAASDLDPDALAFVPQDPVILDSLTVLENIRLVAPDCSRQAAYRALEALGLPDPERALDTPAVRFSRGEARRLATARALLTPARLLVLDEPDAWLDVPSRARLVEALRERSRRSALLLVSHRIDVIARFDQIVALSAAHGLEAVGDAREVHARSSAFRALSEGSGLPTE